MAQLIPKTVATEGVNGPLVQSLTSGQAAMLAYDWTFNYSAVIATAAKLINQDVQAIEAGEPEGQRNYLTITGWAGQAGHAAQTINQQWLAGKVRGPNNSPLGAWPEYPATIAWSANNGDTLELRWLKEEWQLYLLVFTLIAVVGYLVYHILQQGGWTLQTVTPASGSGTPTSGGKVPFIGGTPFRLFWLPWYWDVGIAGAVIAGPYVYRQVVSVEKSRTESAETEAEYRRVKEGGYDDGQY